MMSEPTKQPSVVRFEQAVKARKHEEACSELFDILTKLDGSFGEISGIELDYPGQLLSEPLSKERNVYFCTRMATAISEFFQDRTLTITMDGAIHFLTLQRWLALIFAGSPYVHADHILHGYNTNAGNSENDQYCLENSEEALIKFCILYFPESEISVDLETIWQLSPQLCASLCYALQSPRFIGTDTAFGKRAAILQWFPEKLAQIEAGLENLPANISHDVYMHCSYDTAANKHDVKRGVNQIIRKHLLSNGWQDRDVRKIGKVNGKPVMMVLLEHFHSAHSIYRTHSTSMIAAREHFYLVGIGDEKVDEAGRNVFDEFHQTGKDTLVETLQKVRQLCDQFDPAVFYMPSIGMGMLTIFASNARLAPIQAIALGHPATTHSAFIDYVVVEDDYVGSEDCFSETLIRLPKDALPYVPSALAPQSVEYRLQERPDVVHIGIAATTMKLNPYFLSALQAIRDRSSVPVHFHFALGLSSGITHPYVERFIKSYLGDSATAHQHTPYDVYMRILHRCDMMLNPFPFGNTNGIIDMVTLGLVGVCKTGAEVHEHIDEGLFKRLGLPEWLITQTADEYVECALRLIENHEERLALRRHIIENNGLQTLFSGDPSHMGKRFAQLVDGLSLVEKPAKIPRKTKTGDKAEVKVKRAAKTTKVGKDEAGKADKKSAAKRSKSES